MDIRSYSIIGACIALIVCVFLLYSKSIEGMYASYGPNSTTYYEPGTYTYDNATFRPSQEIGTYTSSVTGGSQVGIIVNTPYDRSDICQQFTSDPLGLENACKTLDHSTCASSECCVLFGGQKCVRGDAHGPTVMNHYSDILVGHRDFHEYQGQCYGNCNRSAV